MVASYKKAANFPGFVHFPFSFFLFQKDLQISGHKIDDF
jgi:hypothetical protein